MNRKALTSPLPIRLSLIDTSNGYDPYESAPLWRHSSRTPIPLSCPQRGRPVPARQAPLQVLDPKQFITRLQHPELWRE